MKLIRLLPLAFCACALQAQGLDPAALTLFNQPKDVWPTYNGDYSGRRFSALEQINQSTVDMLKIEWMYRITSVGPQRGVGGPSIKSTPLLVNGVLYFTIPDHIFAINARTGEHLWQYDFEDRAATWWATRHRHVSGLVYFMTRWLFISLGRRTARPVEKESRRRETAILHHDGAACRENHIIWSRRRRGDGCQDIWNRATRDQWRKVGIHAAENGEPGAGLLHDDADHAGGMTWLPGTYDPDLNLLYWGAEMQNPVAGRAGRLRSLDRLIVR